MKIYQIDSSARKKGSTSRALAKKILDKIKKPGDEVIYRDLDDEMLFVSGLTESGMKIDEKDQTDEHKKMFKLSDTLVKELKESDVIIISAPIYNHGPPATLKAWCDLAARIGETFRFKPNGRREGLATLELIKTENLSARTKNEIDILRAELLIDDKRYEDAEKILSRVKASRQFRIQAQYLLGVVFSHKKVCDQFVKEVTPAILSQTEIDQVFSTGHMYAFADCAAEMSQTSDAIAYLEYAKIQKGVESDEKSRINYLMSKYDGRNFDLPPLEKDSEEPLWNTLLREKKKSDDFTEKYEKWKSESK